MALLRLSGKKRKTLYYLCPKTAPHTSQLSPVVCFKCQIQSLIVPVTMHCKCRLDSSLADSWQRYILAQSSQAGFTQAQVIWTVSWLFKEKLCLISLHILAFKGGKKVNLPVLKQHLLKTVWERAVLILLVVRKIKLEVY